MLKNNYLELLEDINIEEELEKRGINGKIVNENFMFCCPYHGENHPSFGINIVDGEKKGLFNCFSCGEKGNFFHLISFLDDISFEDAIRLFKKGDIDVSVILNLKKYFFNSLSEKSKVNKIKVLDEDILKKFKFPYGKFLKYLKSRKINENSLKKWNILCCDEDFEKLKWKDRIIIPIRDEKNRLISLTARSIIDNIEKSYKVRKVKSSDVKKVLFGLQYIPKYSSIVLVEGEFDCIYLQQFKIPAVCISGNDVSNEQIVKLMKWTSDIIISLDGDIPLKRNDGLPSIKKLKDKLIKYFNINYVILPKDKDPNDLSKKEIEKYYRDKINR